MQANLVKKVEECRARRLKAKAKKIKDDRLHKFQEVYRTTFTRSLPPKEWPHLPPVSAISRFAPVSEAVDSDVAVPLDASVIDKVVAEFPRFVEEWKARRVQEIRKNVEADLGSVLTGFTAGMTDVFSLAVVALTCSSCIHCDYRHLPLLSLDDCLRHSTCEDWDRAQSGSNNLVLWEGVVQNALKLVEMAGLDPLSATSEDMDNANLLFTCVSPSCYHFNEGAREHESQDKCKKIYGFLVYTWRQAVRVLF
jgi:hypothetical protein